MSKRVLIVEDDEDHRDYYSVIFSELGLDFTFAENGREGLEFLDSDQNVDLIMLDLVMPVMGGIEFIQKLRTEKKINIPVLVATVNSPPCNDEWMKTAVQGCYNKLSGGDALKEMVTEIIS
jgi:CheY-like chemotaxis protein